MSVSTIEIDGIEWERHDYGDLVVLQRECDAGCDIGLLLAPVRYCPTCSGSGYIVQRESARVQGGDPQ